MQPCCYRQLLLPAMAVAGNENDAPQNKQLQ
ncbi:hypothetical protein EL79_4217 [Escherichia coli]|nr:hypothetical protein EL80_4133 [Escherichia coli]KGM79543.1 hypothetical protein EL79_4217 [Escherichia coli]